MARPVLFVLAGVNGAGKSSIGGMQLQNAGMTWFNPDTFARELVEMTGLDIETANGEAWTEGVRRIEVAIARRQSHAFETTLGGKTIAQKIQEATQTHDVMIWFCGLSSPEQHLARVRLRVEHGGHDIPEAKIRERYVSAIANLIGLLPHLAAVQVYDNSTDAAAGEAVPDPVLVLQTKGKKVVWPDNVEALQRTPDWAKPIVEAALTGCRKCDRSST